MLVVHTIVSQRVVRDEVFQIESVFKEIIYTRCADPRHERYLHCAFLATKSLLKAQPSMTIVLDIYAEDYNVVSEQWRLDLRISDKQLDVPSVQALLDQIISLTAFLPSLSPKAVYRLLLSKPADIGMPSQCTQLLENKHDLQHGNHVLQKTHQFRDVNDIILQMFYKE